MLISNKSAYYLILSVLLTLCALGGNTSVAAAPPHTGNSTTAQQRPGFFRAREHRTTYAGPGREKPAPEHLKEVLLGYFGPNDPKHPRGGQMWLAAQLAIEQANRQGGYQGKPFRLIPGWSENPWGTGVVRVTRMVYKDHVWAILGGIDGPTTHLAEQVVAKARLSLISPVASDKSINLANVPWMFSCTPGDHLQAPVLAEAIDRQVRSNSFLILSANDHDSHLFQVELDKGLAKRQLVPRYRFKWNPAGGKTAAMVQRTVQAKVEAIVLIADAGPSARFLVALRKAGFTGMVFGGPSMGRRQFLHEAGHAAEAVVFPLLFLADTKEAKQFVRTFHDRYGTVPDYATAHTYDAVRLCIAAVRKAGLNRPRIRDALVQLAPWNGVTGTFRWDKLGSNVRPVHLGTISSGKVVELP